MEVGKLYKHKNTELIVKCTLENKHNDTFCGYVIRRDNKYRNGYMAYDWVSWIFEPFEEDNNVEEGSNIQIGGDHYKKLKIQPTEFIHANEIPFIEGNIIKYVIRHRDKNGIEDLKKAKHYIDLLIKFEYENTKKF